MNQKYMHLNLRDFTKNDHPFGNVQGKDTYRKLADHLDGHPGIKIIGISLAGIEATDASFPRESVVALAKAYRGEKGFFLESLTNRDLLDNWNYAAQAKDQPLTVWNGKGYEILGHPSETVKELVAVVLSKGQATAAKVASELGISVPNASTKLKKLVNQGYLLRIDEVAESGGTEYIYLGIGPF